MAEVNSYGISQCYFPHDSWAGAMKACKDWGYQLPNAYELNSLAKDIFKLVELKVPKTIIARQYNTSTANLHRFLKSV